MYISKFKWFLAVLVISFLYACSSDSDALTDDADTEFTDFSERGRHGGQNNNNGRNNEKVSTDIIVDWLTLYLDLDRFAFGMRPNASARAIAYINLAAYETVAPQSKSYQSNTIFLEGFDLDNDVQGRINYNYALNQVYAQALDHFVINIADEHSIKIDQLSDQIIAQNFSRLSDNEKEASQDWAEKVIDAVIAYAESDQAAESQILEPQPNSYEPPVADGNWTYSAPPERALYPYWEDVRTFVADAESLTSIPPANYSLDVTSDYYLQMMEVYQVNNEAKANQSEQLWIAEFWSDDVEGLMMSPPARQVSIAVQLIEENDMKGQDALYMGLKLGFALNDAAVAIWKYKYEYMVMRPNVYIQAHIDPNFQTNLYRLIYWPNPSFPSYPSGHSGFASAGAGVFKAFYGNDYYFVDKSHEGRTEFLSTPRAFNTFDEMAEENAYSRIPLGVHMRMDCDEGLRMGYEISEKVNSYDLQKENS